MMSILRAASAMPQLPHGNRAVSRLLINECVSYERRLHHLEIERLLRCEAVEAAAPHEQNLIDQDIALRAQLDGIRSEERRVGKAWVRTCRCGWSTHHKKKKKEIIELVKIRNN